MTDQLTTESVLYPAEEAGALSIQVRDPNEAKRGMEAIIACLGGAEECR